MRKGLTREYKEDKLKDIQKRIKADSHYQATATRYYGDFDPLIETENHINACICGAKAVLVYDIPDLDQVPGARNSGTPRPYQPRKQWFVRCGACGSASMIAKKPWLAVLQWNKSPLSINPPYRTLPVFGLRGLDADAAAERLQSIRADLELRSKEAGLRRDLGRTKTNQKYLDRLKAFLQWCIYAQSLVKFARQMDDSRGSNHKPNGSSQLVADTNLDAIEGM